MAVASSIIAASIAAVGAIAGGVTAAAASRGGGSSATPAPTYNAKAEQNKAAVQESNANRRRVMAETDTIKTSALGNTGTTQTQKKTLLGG